MKRLTYQTLEELGNQEFILKEAKERVLQFGEGNFLRGFVDYFIDLLNETQNFNTKVVIVQPIAIGMADTINEQDGLYQLYLRGLDSGEKINQRRLISCISRAISPYEDYQAFLDTAHNPEMKFIVSNTTESGIVYDESCKFGDAPPSSFPAKLTRLLYERYTAFENAEGYVILSCELIDYNGSELKKCVEHYAEEWGLGNDFSRWLVEKNTFCNTLVDRIITGYPRGEADKLNEENGYEDKLIDTGEPFAFWVIEGPQSLKKVLPFEEAGLPVIFTDDHVPYKKKKVRILNGTQTALTLPSFMAGFDVERDCMHDDTMGKFIHQVLFDEIIPSLSLDKEEMVSFANACVDRLKNPYIDHMLIDITLNSVSKWKARVLPTMKEYFLNFDKLPKNVVFSFAGLINFYSGSQLRQNALVGKRGSEEYLIRDDKSVLEYFYANKGRTNSREFVEDFASMKDFFGEDLNQFNGFTDAVFNHLLQIEKTGMYEAMTRLVKEM